jgi:hypothetical protein
MGKRTAAARGASEQAIGVTEGGRNSKIQFVFTLTGRTSIARLADFQLQLSSASGTAGWTPHDLRRPHAL